MTRIVFSLAGIAVVGLVVLALGWWFVIRSDAELATEPPEIPQDLVEATSTPAATDAPTTTGDAAEDVLTFSIVSDRSEGAYFVDEELASVGVPSTAKGSTTAITGEFSLTADGALAEGVTSQFTVDVTTLQSDESRRDNRVQQALETGSFPTATFTITSLTGYDAAIAEGEQQNLQLTGTLSLHGVEREVTWEVEALREANVITALATVTISFADYGVTPPDIGGFVSVEDEATLQVQLVAEQV
ncbi:MAG: YceI family protein [Dehalococcoidia bacterium]